MYSQSTKSPDQIQPLAWRINDACKRIGISRATIYKMAAGGRLRIVKIGGRSLVPDAEIERLAKGEAA